MRILLIDDSAAYREEFAVLLADAKIKHSVLDYAATADAAARQIADGIHDIYFIDYRLPGGDGLSLLRDARRAGVTKPIIMLTGYGSPQIDIAAEQAGATDYLPEGRILGPDAQPGNPLRDTERRGGGSRRTSWQLASAGPGSRRHWRVGVGHQRQHLIGRRACGRCTGSTMSRRRCTRCGILPCIPMTGTRPGSAWRRHWVATPTSTLYSASFGRTRRTRRSAVVALARRQGANHPRPPKAPRAHGRRQCRCHRTTDCRRSAGIQA